MTRQISVGGVKIGGGASVSIQSMLNTKTTDVEASLQQIYALRDAGCQIVRLAVPNVEAARGFDHLYKHIQMHPHPYSRAMRQESYQRSL